MIEPPPNRKNKRFAWYQEPAFHYGLKFGGAGVIVVYLALLIKLQEPTWALFTVFVLMIAQYVGAIGEKSIFRLLGTVVGGLIGYLLTSFLEQSPGKLGVSGMAPTSDFLISTEIVVISDNVSA